MIKKEIFLIILFASLLSACAPPHPDDVEASNPKPTQQDAYARIEDCLADWGDKELCMQAEKAQQEAYAQAQQSQSSGDSSSIVFLPLFFGPSYEPGHRYVTTSSGVKYTPKTYNGTGKPLYSSNYRPNVSSVRPSNVEKKKSLFDRLILTKNRTPRSSSTTSSTSKSSSNVSRGGFGRSSGGSSAGG